MLSNGVSIYGIDQDRDSLSIWRVVLTPGMDRDVYIKQCFLTGTVSISNFNGETSNKIKIGKLNLQQIVFPIDDVSYGSEVLCASLPYSGELRVIDVYSTESEFTDQKEEQFVFQKRINDGYASEIIDGEGNIILSVLSNSKVGKITINCIGNNKSGVVDISSNGVVQIKSPNVKLISEEIQLNEKGEPILLGQKTVQFLSDLLDQLGQESAGPYPLLGNSLYIQMKDKLEELKSKLSTVA